MNKHIALLLGSALSLAACGTDPVAPPADAAPAGDVPAADAPAADAPADGAMGACYTQEGAAALCPTTAVAQASATAPTFRVTHIRITAPTALTSAILQNTVNDAIHRGNFLWGISLDLTGNMVRTGALNTQMVTRGTVGQGAALLHDAGNVVLVRERHLPRLRACLLGESRTLFEKAPACDDALLQSHAIPQNAVEALRTGDWEGFVRLRGDHLREEERKLVAALGLVYGGAADERG